MPQLLWAFVPIFDHHPHGKKYILKNTSNPNFPRSYLYLLLLILSPCAFKNLVLISPFPSNTELKAAVRSPLTFWMHPALPACIPMTCAPAPGTPAPDQDGSPPWDLLHYASILLVLGAQSWTDSVLCVKKWKFLSPSHALGKTAQHAAGCLGHIGTLLPPVNFLSAGTLFCRDAF